MIILKTREGLCVNGKSWGNKNKYLSIFMHVLLLMVII